MESYGPCTHCKKDIGGIYFTHTGAPGKFCSYDCGIKESRRLAAPTPPTPSQVLTGILDTLKERLTLGDKDAKQLESLRASVRILEKQKLVLKNEASRLYKKVRDLDNLCAEQIEYIEELERKVIAEDDNPSYIVQLHAILDGKDKEINELRKELQKSHARSGALEIENKGLKLANDGWKNKVNELTEEARQCPYTHKF